MRIPVEMILSVAVVSVAFFVGREFGRTDGYKKGMLEGVATYHQACYNVGGYVFGEDGSVVQCIGLGKIPKEELEKNLEQQKPLDKGTKI